MVFRSGIFSGLGDGSALRDGSALEENVSALVLVDFSALGVEDFSALGDISLLRVGSALGVVSALGNE